MNNTSRETLSYITLCMNVCPYLFTKILHELFVFMLFGKNDYSQGLADHMQLASHIRGAAS